jgi:peroxiredoxin Q/BCP
MSSLKVGIKAPEFDLPDQNGEMHSLKDYAGQWVLLYFYPKDDTPGCTAEACALRDNLPKFKKLKAQVFGVSTDSVKSHRKFADKFELPFTLLSDESKELVKAYDVYHPKKFMGREFLGTMRESFLIDDKGNIAKIYEGVKPADHADEVLADLANFQK